MTTVPGIQHPPARRWRPFDIREPRPYPTPVIKIMGKVVTTGIGFRCNDGIVLATDSQYTGVLKTQGQKLYEITSASAIKLCVAGAGPVSLIRKAVKMLENSIHAKQIASLADAEDEIEQSLRGIYSKYIDPAPEYRREEVELLVAVWIEPNTIGLFSTDQTTASPVKDYAVIGTGGSLIEYIMETSRTLDDSAVAAKYMRLYAVKMAKQFDIYTGKETQLKTLMADGRIVGISKQEASNAEEFFDELFEGIRLAITAMSTELVSDDDLAEFLSSIGIQEALVKFRTKEQTRKEHEEKLKRIRQRS